MPTTPDDPELLDDLGPHDPRRRALRGGRLQGDALKAEIRRLAAQEKSLREIADATQVSRAYVHKVLTEEPKTEERIPPELLRWMVERLGAGDGPADLLDARPGDIAALFRSRAEAAPDRERLLLSLRKLISSGKDTDGAARELYRARQAGRLVRPKREPEPTPPAAGRRRSTPVKPSRRGK